MPDFKKINKILEKMGGEERFVIVEKGEPKWVVLSMADYEKLKRDQTAAVKAEEELPSFQEEGDEEEGWTSPEIEEEKEPELYFESLEDEEEDVNAPWNLSQSREKTGRGEWNEIPF